MENTCSYHQTTKSYNFLNLNLTKLQFFALMNIPVVFQDRNTCVSRTIWKISIIWKDSTANMSLQADKQMPNIAYYTMVNRMNPLTAMSKRQIVASFALALYSIGSIPDVWYAHNMVVHISVTSTSYTVWAVMHVCIHILRKSVMSIRICLLWTMSWLFKCGHIHPNPIWRTDVWDHPQTDIYFLFILFMLGLIKLKYYIHIYILYLK